ncbi:retrovirus-related Pol polyprotein from transposon 297 [Trichonephila clavipes]|nr:retrovirus-related Pol polyprotein from transposon 297 [Trichonephila clavipes]
MSRQKPTTCQCNFTGSSSKMEIVGASRIFLRSEKNRRLHYTQYYGDDDSKAFMSVKDTYGLNSVTNFECIGHVQKRVGRSLDWFEVLGYRVVEDKATDYAHISVVKQFPVVRNRSELETRFYSLSQEHNQKPFDFVYDWLKIHKILKLEMMEEKLIDHIISWLEDQILDYVEVRNPQTTSNLQQIIDKKIGGKREVTIDTRTIVDHGESSIDLRVKVLRIIRFDGRRRGGQSDHRFHNQGGRQGGSRNSASRGQNDRNRYLNFQAIDANQPGLTHVLYHEIDTGDKGLVVSRPYRYDRVKQGIIDYHIEKMLQQGTIRPIQSPYASPVVLTRKNNGLPLDSPEAYRFAIDYRKLNAITKYPRYQLPVIDDLITNIPHTGVMSTLDLKRGYFQLAISRKDIEKTAFITSNGTFTLLRMLFALSGAAPKFQKVIDIILKPVIGRFLSVYMDDVIITSPSFNEHLDHLNQKKGAKFNWSTEAQGSFDKIKRALTEAPVLQLPNFTEQFNLFTDASGVGIGAVLNQNHRPIAFASRTLNKAERNYTVTERESLLALALNSREQLIREQREDPELGHIYRYLENLNNGFVNATVCEGWSQDFKIFDGLLFYAKYSTTLGEQRVYISRSLREAIMKEFHDLPLAGHLEKRKTYLKLCDTCYFPYMRKYIFEYVSTCDRCQKFNYKNALPAGRLIPIVSNYPNEIVTLDLLGSYPASRPERYRFLLVITDHFNTWSELILYEKLRPRP